MKQTIVLRPPQVRIVAVNRITMTIAGTYTLRPPRLERQTADAGAACGSACGAATVTGQVRKENQDTVTIGAVGPWRIGLCADGLGGLPLGREASTLAVRAASVWLGERLASVGALDPEELRHLAVAGLGAAQDALARHALEVELPAGGGLRTTLIVVVAGPSHWAYAHAGDGFGICIPAGAGATESWLQPQKGTYANEVVCSLGPRLEGTPRSGVQAWQTGMTLAFGSDGIGDQVDLDGFGMHLLDWIRTSRGDLSAICMDLLEQLAGLRQDTGYAFDDNLSLVVLQAPGPWGDPC